MLEISYDILEDKWGCSILAINTGKDHIHVMFEASPQTQLSKLINNYKTVSSRILRKEFPEILNRYYFDLAWQNKDMGTFAKEAARFYAYTSRSFQPVRIRLAVLSFVYGYADEEGARYAKDHVFDFLAGCIDEKDESLAIEALKAPGLVSKVMLKKVLQKFIDAGMSEAAAVITERTAPKIKKTSITL